MRWARGGDGGTEAGHCWWVQLQGSWQLEDTPWVLGRAKVPFGAGCGTGMECPGRSVVFGGRRKRGAARWAEVQQQEGKHKEKGGWFRVGGSGPDGGWCLAAHG